MALNQEYRLFSNVNCYYKSCRYQGIAFTSTDLLTQDELAKAIRSRFADFDYWQNANVESSPPLDCHANQFLKQAFDPARKGLIIAYPEQWLCRWSPANQSTFWGHLSRHYGGAPVIVLAKDVPSTVELLEPYFKPQPVDAYEARLWISKYQSLQTKTL